MIRRLDNANASIQVNIHVPFDEQLAGPLQQLLVELTDVAGLHNILASVYVYFVPHEVIGPAVNRMVSAEAYPVGGHVPRAVVVPYSNDSSLLCTVFIDGNHLNTFTESSRPDDLILSLLEEFLHIRIYGLRWEQGHRVGGVAGSDDPPENVIASRVHDEYVVCRLKSEIASTLPLFDAPNQPGYRSMRVLQYGEKVSDSITSAEAELREMRTLWGAGALTFSQLHSRLGDIVFRRVLDPLSRSHAFFDGLPETERNHYVLEELEHPFFLGKIRPFWQRIYNNLNNSFDREFRNMQEMVESISGEIRILMNELGDSVRYPDAD